MLWFMAGFEVLLVCLTSMFCGGWYNILFVLGCLGFWCDLILCSVDGFG